MLLVFLFCSASMAWGQTKYTFDVALNIEEELITVSQTIEYTNTSDESLDTLYLYDWANSYQGAPAPLAKHLANEFNRSFYISANSKLGYTQIDTLYTERFSSWSRSEDQLDIIKINLVNRLDSGEQIKINLNYVIKIPDDKFTGVGINSDKGVLLRDLFVTVAPRYNDE